MHRSKSPVFFRCYYQKLFVLFLMLCYVYFYGLMERWSGEYNECCPKSGQFSMGFKSSWSNLIWVHRDACETSSLLDIDKRQGQRRQRLKASCHNRSPSEIMPAGSELYGLPRDIFSHVIVNDKHRFLYCEIPKVATSNWKRVLLTLNGHAKSPWEAESRDVHNKSRGYFRYLNEYSASEIVVRLKTYYKFLFVREPFERLVSAYRNKFVESYNMTFFERTYGQYIIRKFRTNFSRNNKITFEEFIRYILDGKSEVMNIHWQLYDEICQPCLVWYDFIGYLEDIRQDSGDVLRILGLSDRVVFPFNITSNYQIPTSVLKRKYFSKLPKSYMERLYMKYRYDFEMFGYSRPGFEPNNKRNSIS